MYKMKKLLSGLLSVLLLATVMISPIYAIEAETVNFDLQSTVYDDGEAIDTVILDVSNLDVDETRINKDMFNIHAVSSSIYTLEQEREFFGDDSKHGLQHCGLYEGDRKIESMELKDGKIILHLVTDSGVSCKQTLDFTANFTTEKGCNSLLKIDYTITLNESLPLKDGRTVNVTFNQNQGIKNEEIEKFTEGEHNGFKYQFYTPKNANDGQKHPLIVWFHGGGESGYRGLHYNNLSQLKANRGAVSFVSDEAQKIFDGAYVLAPQTPHEWSENLNDAKDLIEYIVQNNNVDTARIYVYGCSAGGYMTLDMVVHNPDLFAAAVVTCPAIDQKNINTYGQGRQITDEEIKAIDTPVWLVQAKDDTTVKYEESALRVYNLLKDKGAILSTYETGGHSSWIYTANNDPIYNGEHVWQWTSRQTLTSVNNQTVPDTKSEKITSVKTGDTTSSDIYVIVGCVSATILAHYVLKNKESIKGKMFN